MRAFDSDPGQSDPEHRFDSAREGRTGIAEAVLCLDKSPQQIAEIVTWVARESGLKRLLLTRLSEGKYTELPADIRAQLQHNPTAGTAVWGEPAPIVPSKDLALLTAGSSDLPVAAEAQQTLAFYGLGAACYQDIGISSVRRFLDLAPSLTACRVLIVFAGHEGALFSLVAGHLPGLVVAVPTSTGYGVAKGGETAFRAALAACAPGVVAVNVDNGFGAAVAALKILRPAGRAEAP